VIVDTPDGEVEFPDTMSDNEVKSVLQKKYGAPAAAPDAPKGRLNQIIEGDILGKPPTNPNAYVPGQIAGYQVPGLATLENFGNRAADTMTAGLPDTIAGALGRLTGGPNADQMRAATEAGKEQLGPIASTAADIIGYTASGAPKAGAALARLLGGGLAARMASGAVEGGATSLAGSLGHGETDPEALGQSLALGTAIGGATGVLPAGRKQVHTPSTSDLKFNAETAWQWPQNTQVNPNDVSTALVNTHLNLTPGERRLMGSKVDKTVQGIMKDAQVNSLTADDVSKFQDVIMEAANSKKKRRIAGLFTDALENTLGPEVQRARTATNIAKTSGELDALIADPATAPAKVKGMLAKQSQYYQTDPALPDMLESIAAKDKPEPSIGRQVSLALGKHALGAAAGTGIGYVTGGGLPADLAGAALGAAVPAAFYKNRMGAIRNSLLAAKHLNATGMKLSPNNFAGPSPIGTLLSELIRNAPRAPGMAGSY